MNTVTLGEIRSLYDYELEDGLVGLEAPGKLVLRVGDWVYPRGLRRGPEPRRPQLRRALRPLPDR